MRAVEIKKLSEKYRIKFIIGGKVSWEEVWSLEDISFSVDRAEVIGIIGQNGAGKTTLLRLLAGMLVPDKGELKVEGKVSAIMELGAGLNPEFTGRENIILNARIYGISEEILKQKIDEIIAFSNLAKFIDAPIKYYSQGMYMRLAFSLAIFAEPDILLIDDILAVGDEEAQQKCRRKIVQLKEAGKTIILVSHDMGLVNKLCDRVLLLEKGRLIKEGPAQSVIPYYLEMAGEKEGIAVLEKGNAKVVFNNGRISISYAKNFINSSSGGYCSSFDTTLKFHSPSTNLFWQISSATASRIIAEGKSNKDGPVLQNFSAELKGNILDLSIRNFEPPQKQYEFNLFLTSGYDKWILAEKEGSFPEFCHKTNWHDFGINSPAGQKLGIFSEDLDFLPGLIFNTKGTEEVLKIFNSGYEQESRIIHLASSKGEFSFSLALYPEKKEFENSFDEERRILLIKQQEESKKLEEERAAREEAERLEREKEHKRMEQERLIREEAERKRIAGEEKKRLEQERLAREENVRLHTLSRGVCRLFVDIENRRLRIYFNDLELTSPRGINCIFLLEDLIDHRWQVKKSADDELVLTLDFGSLKQYWNLSFKQDNCLTVKIAIEAEKEISIDNHLIRLEFIDKYNLWQTPYEEGVFSDSQYVNNIAPLRLKDGRISRIAVASENRDFPKIIFEAIGEAKEYVGGIFRQKYEKQESSCISFSPILPWSVVQSLPEGKHDYFEGRIIFDAREDLKNSCADKTPALIGKNKDLEFNFDRGRANIAWKGKPLSSGLGIYTSLRSQNVWYDSTQAAWRFVKTGEQHVVIEGQWPYIPIVQVWDLEIVDGESMSWQVAMEVHSKVRIEIEQANIMLVEGYKKWEVENTARGEFLDEFTPDYDILPFRYWYGLSGKNSLIASGDSLPKIIFTNTSHIQMPKGLIENSDCLYCSRIIQYQRANSGISSPKKYQYFSGVIKIEDK